ncbi:hypothetical protein RSAG8_10582, partial [Rhizoctonia solani AG-8 WAC10335]
MPMAQTAELHEHNHLQHSNRLPLELLAHIFVLCDENTDYEDDKEVPKRYIQFVAPAVCRHWRKVAHSTTALWTTIRILKPVPCKRTALYLARSGSTVPLDIKIRVMGPQSPGKGDKFQKLQTYVDQTIKTFAFIIKHGGFASRWKSLDFETDIFASCAVAMGLLSKACLSSLESLELAFMGPSDHPDDMRLFRDAYRGKTKPKLLFSNPPPQLRSIRLEGILNSHLFDDVLQPQLVGLTDIYISFEGWHPGVDHIHSMLAASPRLTKLCFDSGSADPEVGDKTATGVSASSPVVLSDLVSLTFMHITYPVWSLSVLKTFKAPALQNLELSFWIDPAASQLLVDYISNQLTQSSPHFPVTLAEMSFFTMMGTNPDPEPLLRAYPNIIKLRTGSLAALLKRPWLVPNLATLQAVTQDPLELKNLVIGRCGDSLPLKAVEATWYGNDCALSLDDKEQLERLVRFTVWDQEPSAEDEGEDNGSQDHVE